MGLGSGIQDPGSGKKSIPDPGSGSRVKKAPDPGSGSATLDSYKYGFQAEKEGQKVEHHICVSHLPRLANPGTSQQMEDHQADIKVPVWFIYVT
jgi:hypothetical protein